MNLEDLAVQQGLEIGTWQLDLATSRFLASERCARILGVDPGALATSEDWLRRIDEGDRRRVALELKTHISGLSRAFEVEYRVWLKDGRLRWVRARGMVARDQKGIAQHMAGHKEDITSRKLLEEQLRSSELRFRTLIEHSPDAIAVLRDGRFLYANGRMHEMVAVDPIPGLAGRLVLEHVHRDDYTDVINDLVGLTSESGAAVSREVRLVSAQGDNVLVELKGLRMVYDQAPAIYLLARDLSERKKMQAKLAETERMVSLGTLAAGVAHEINNPLTFVSSNIEMMMTDLARLGAQARSLQKRLDSLQSSGISQDEIANLRDTASDLLDPHTFDDLLELASDATQGSTRVHSIVSDLKLFVRSGDEMPAPLHVGPVLETALKITGHELRQRARVEKDIDPSVQIVAPEGRLCQLFVNLLVNAAHAIAAGNPSDNLVKVTCRRHGSDVVIHIRDSGQGVKPEHLSKLFDPFFTTKPPGVGSGLGLSICRHIVEECGGQITLESQHGKGAEVVVKLPAHEVGQPLATGLTSPVPTPIPEESSRPGPRGRVLVIDDEPILCRTLQRALEKEHEVVVVNSGREALAVIARDRRFSAVLCDLMMLDVSGQDVFESVVKLSSELAERFVFITGGATSESATRFLANIDNLTLHKPVDLKKLRRLVRQMVMLSGVEAEGPAEEIKTDETRTEENKTVGTRTEGTPRTRRSVSRSHDERRRAPRFSAHDIRATLHDESLSWSCAVVDFSRVGLRVTGQRQWPAGTERRELEVILERNGISQRVSAGVRAVRVAPTREGVDLCLEIYRMDDASHLTYRHWLEHPQA